MAVNLICTDKIVSPRAIDNSLVNDIDSVYFYIDKNKQNKCFAIQFILDGGASSFCDLKRSTESNKLYTVYKVGDDLIDMPDGIVDIRVIELPTNKNDAILYTDSYTINLSFKSHNALAEYTSLKRINQSISEMYKKIYEMVRVSAEMVDAIKKEREGD